MQKFFRMVAAVPQVVFAFLTLKATVEALQKDPAVREAVDQHPMLAGYLSLVSQQWRALEEAIERLR